jgi:catechol 2,3-dioxygenase-like lactoylglutathione lyase family enzyme
MAKILPRGIEHIGITVPDIDAAERFLHHVFGAQRLYSLVTKDQPDMGDAATRSQNGLADGTAMRALRMLRIGNGPNVELFELTGYRRDDAAVINDVGMTHFGLYCDEIAPIAERFIEAGGTMLHGPNELTAQESGQGNYFWFGRCPWGTLVELIQFPSPLDYDSGVTAERWRPAAIDPAPVAE